jgi:hypothetical protein
MADDLPARPTQIGPYRLAGEIGGMARLWSVLLSYRRVGFGLGRGDYVWGSWFGWVNEIGGDRG